MSKPVSNSVILAIAVPAMLTNVATALFGVADMWAIGRIGDPAAQGAVEVGAKFFLTIVVVFNFLRSSTIALTAQAGGRDDSVLRTRILVRTFALSLVIGAVLLALTPVIIPAGLTLFNATGEVLTKAGDYADIRYWSVIPWLLNATLTGWLVGRKRMRAVLVVEVVINLFHIALDLVTVLGLGWGVRGVATATLSSEAGRMVLLAVLVLGDVPIRRCVATARDRATWDFQAIGATLRLNRDLFFRTLLLMGASVILTRSGAAQGPVILAANGILYQLFSLSALLLDGFESAAQVLCAEALGAADKPLFRQLVARILVWASGLALVIAALYCLEAGPVAAAFSTSAEVVASVETYIGWAAVMPIVGVISFVFDGVFIGAGWTRGMLHSMALSLAGFLVLLMLTQGLGNNGLWLSFSAFFLLRALTQFLLMPGLLVRNFRAMIDTPSAAH
jgi:MATE family multidrug resistance protein